MSRQNWTEIRSAEWRRRLAAVRTIALRGLAENGLPESSDDFDVASLVMDGAVGDLLRPSIAGERAKAAARVEQAQIALGDKRGDFQEDIFRHLMSVAESAYRFSVIAGCHLSWPIVEAMPAPTGPPAAAVKAPRRRAGGAR